MIEQVEYIKKFALQDNSALTVKQLGETIARMCDDAIREAVEHSVQADGADWICQECQTLNSDERKHCSVCGTPRR